MNVLGLACPFWHDPSAALVVDGEAVCGCAEGYVLLDGLCVSDPCEPADGSDPCPPPPEPSPATASLGSAANAVP